MMMIDQRRLLVAPVAVAAALGVKILLAPVLGDQSPFLLISVGVMVCAWYGGLGPGLLATGLGALGGSSLFLSRSPFGLPGAMTVGLFVFQGALISALGDSLQRAARRAEAAHTRMRAVLDTAVDGILTVDERGCIESLNPAVERIFGYTAGELVGQSLDVVLPERREIPGIGGQVVGRRKDGRTVPLDLAVSELRLGRRRLFTAILRDLGERQRAEEKFRLAVEAAPNAMLMVTGEGTIALVNAHAEQLFGYDRSELIGMPVERLVPQRFRDAHPEERRRFVANPQVRAMGAGRDLHALRKDGREVPVEIGLNPLVTPEGTFVLGAVIDISERKRAEETLRDESRRKDAFLGMLSHELRNPLATLCNALRLFRLDVRRDEALPLAERQTERLRRMVDDLLDVSRVTRGKVVLQKEVVSLQEVADSALRAAQPFLAERRHEIATSLPPEPLHVEGDRVRLEQVLGNLLENAGKYTEPGGRVWLVIERQDGQAVVRVGDTGMGIPREDLTHIFELFAQTDRSLDRAGGGLGIGLTVVRNLVELHGGAVEARSAGLGHGSEFIVRLPALPPATVAARAPDHLPGPAPRALRLLVVDDNTDFVASLKPMLELMGHEVRVAYTGAAALTGAEQEPPDVILLDIGLPGMDGYEVARRLRQRTELARTRVVALSGYGRDEDRRRAEEAGFDHHLTKPVDPDVLQSLLGRMEGSA